MTIEAQEQRDDKHDETIVMARETIRLYTEGAADVGVDVDKHGMPWRDYRYAKWIVAQADASRSVAESKPVAWMVMATNTEGFQHASAWVKLEDAHEDAQGWRINDKNVEIVPLFVRSATAGPTVLQLSKAIEYGVNCHSIDNAANLPDFVIASKIAATVHRRLAEIVTQGEYVSNTTKEKS